MHRESDEDGRPAAELRTWLQLLFPPIPGRVDAVELRAIDPERRRRARQRWVINLDKAKLKRRYRHVHAGLGKIPDLVAGLDREGFNVYAGVATRVRPAGTKEDLSAATAAWVDLDRPSRITEDLVATCELLSYPPPSMIVASGGGLHAYWLLADPLDLRTGEGHPDGAENIAQLEAINRGITRILGGDKAAVDATRVLRPPGTTNRPKPEKRSKGRVEAPVRLLFADGDRRYSLDDLAPFEEAGRRSEGSARDGGSSSAEPSYERREDDGELPERVREILDRDDRVRARYQGEDDGLDDASDSGIDMSLANLLARRGCEGWEIEAALRRSREERGAEKGPGEKGDGYFVRTVNRALESAAAEARQSAQEDFAEYREGAAAEGTHREGRPTILQVQGQLPTILDEAEAALLRGGAPIYQRAGALVRPAHLDEASDEEGVRRRAGALVILAVREPWLVEEMASTARWTAPDRKGAPRPADPRAKYASHLLARAGDWRFPVLRGIVAAPAIDRDGRLIQAPGYDAASGLLLDFEPGAFPQVPENPSREDAAAALERLARPLRAYRFDREAPRAARAVALSAMLTAVAGPAMRTAPLHAIDAPTAGSGKTILAECAGILATGTAPAAMSLGKTEEETEKRLSTVLACGDPVLLLDNCERSIGGDFLCSMLTNEVVQARILGLSERRMMPSTSLVIATGNNLVFRGDACRRVVRCRVDPEVERPDRREFGFDPRDEVRAARPELVAAALTVLRAYHVAGRPGTLTPFGSFSDYDAIRGALAWLGWGDPAETREAVMDADPEKDALAEVMDAWEAAYGDRAVSLAEIDRDDLGADFSQEKEGRGGPPSAGPARADHRGRARLPGGDVERAIRGAVARAAQGPRRRRPALPAGGARQQRFQAVAARPARTGGRVAPGAEGTARAAGTAPPFRRFSPFFMALPISFHADNLLSFCSYPLILALECVERNGGKRRNGAQSVRNVRGKVARAPPGGTPFLYTSACIETAAARPAGAARAPGPGVARVSPCAPNANPGWVHPAPFGDG